MVSAVNLLDFDRPKLGAWLESLGEKPFRAKQLTRWIHQLGVHDFAAMTDIAKPLRQRLIDLACIALPTIQAAYISQDGTRKWLLGTDAVNSIETVFIPEQQRGTLCISSQIGCALACTFCATGWQGFNRNLTVAEIIGQLVIASASLREQTPDRPISNVVMMGMGEPLANYDHVLTAMQLMLDDSAYGLSRRRLTLSTSGLVPAMDRLKEDCPVALAVSLHAPNDALRDILVPINKKYPLSILLAACQRYISKAPRDFVTFEYVLLHEVNDSVAQARALVALVRDVPCKFNLIPFNPFPNSHYQTSRPEAIAAFRDVLLAAGMVVTIRKTRGRDIAAACGQLAGKVANKRVRVPVLAEHGLS